MKWRPFTYQGTTYDLSHLHPFEWTYVLPATGDKPARHYPFVVTFSLHTFTKGIEDRAYVDTELLYSDSREEREFDFDRYELSKRLPEIVQSLGTRKCRHAQGGNFFTIDLIDEGGASRSYEVYFTASRSGKRQGRLNLFIQSAYERTRNHGARPESKPPIRFHVIAHNTLNNKPIKAPK
ncbi:MAG: hypothetical protein C0631_18995 [Sedimenticola sp.]|nr:MAG: hypothetical protein C0631_18995 [Sedimenticola sp.]